MEKKKTKPLKVTENQQKLFDVLALYWKELLSYTIFLIGVSLGLGRYIKSNSEQENISKINLQHQARIEEIQKKCSEDNAKMVNSITEIVKTMSPKSEIAK